MNFFFYLKKTIQHIEMLSYLPLLLIPLVSAHSWLECSDYATDVLGEFDRSLCSGYPRAFERQFREGFGQDTGRELRATNCAQYPLSSAGYSDKIPMATYAPGQVIHLSHPAKNHVADVCTNAFIPSTSFVVKMSSSIGTDTFDVPLALVGDEHTNSKIDHLGFQRCNRFCDDMDKSHCISSWALPENIAEGVHSFIWTWVFNPGEAYSSCFDAMIVSGNGTLPEPSSTPSPTPAQTILETEEPTPSPTPEATPEATPSPTPEATPSPSRFDVITSDAPSHAGPLALLQQYVMTIVGSFNITAVLNVTTTNIQ